MICTSTVTLHCVLSIAHTGFQRVFQLKINPQSWHWSVLGLPGDCELFFLQYGAKDLCDFSQTRINDHEYAWPVPGLCFCHLYLSLSLTFSKLPSSPSFSAIRSSPNSSYRSKCRQIRTFKIGPRVVLVPKNSWVWLTRLGSDFLGSCTELMMFLSARVLLIKIDCTVLQPTLLWK